MNIREITIIIKNPEQLTNATTPIVNYEFDQKLELGFENSSPILQSSHSNYYVNYCINYPYSIFIF